MTASTVYIIDDEASARKSLAWLLGSVNLTTKAFATGEEFLQSPDATQPGCVVLDLRLPGMSGLTILERLTAIELAPPVVMVTAYGTVAVATRAMRAGAITVLEKPYDDQHLIDAVHEAIQLDGRRRAVIARRAEGQARLALLSQRERELLDLIVAGHSNKGIARRLSLSTKTVEFHRANLMSKLQVRTIADLLRLVLPLLGESHTHRANVAEDTPLPKSN